MYKAFGRSRILKSTQKGCEDKSPAASVDTYVRMAASDYPSEANFRVCRIEITSRRSSVNGAVPSEQLHGLQSQIRRGVHKDDTVGLTLILYTAKVTKWMTP